MAEFFKLNIDARELDREFDSLPLVTQKAVVNTLNKVGRLGNKAIAKFIKDNYNIKSRSLKIGKLVTLKRADVRRSISTFTIFIRKQGRGLFKYGAKQVKGGVRVVIKKTPKTIRTAFISTWKSGDAHKRVFVRDKSLGTYSKGGGKPRTKRRALFGPMIADLYVSIRAGRVLDETVEKNFQPILDEEFNKQFEKRR